MNVTLMLCDSAQAVSGKLYILGGGWTVIGPEPSPTAIAILVRVPWDEANRRHRLRLELVSEDGNPVRIQGPQGLRPLRIDAEFEVGRPPGHRPGRPLPIVFGMNIGPLPLQPDSHYEWRCYINDETRDDWRLEFSTRAQARQPA
jgi:hypothetical protein